MSTFTEIISLSGIKLTRRSNKDYLQITWLEIETVTFYSDISMAFMLPISASCTIGTGSFPGVKQPGRGADHPPPSSA
jgi:hypothetical protein